MKTKILFITLLLLIVGCSKSVEDSTLIKKEGLMYLPDSDSPYSGEVFTNYDTGEKEYQGTYDNGLLVIYDFFNKDGTTKDPININTVLVKRGQEYFDRNTNIPYNGKVFSLFENGNIKTEGVLINGFKKGNWKIHGFNGKILSIEYPFEGLTEIFDENHPKTLELRRRGVFLDKNKGIIKPIIENYRELHNKDESVFLVEEDSSRKIIKKSLLITKSSTHFNPYIIKDLSGNGYIVGIEYDSVKVGGIDGRGITVLDNYEYSYVSSDHVVTKTDEKLNVEWTKSGILRSLSDGSSIIINNKENSTDLTLIDTMGTELFTHNFKLNTNNEKTSIRIKELELTHDNQFLLLGNFDPEPDNRYSNVQTYITKIDSFGTQYWKNIYDVERVKNITLLEMDRFLITSFDKVLVLDSEGEIISQYSEFGYRSNIVGPYISSNGMGLLLTTEKNKITTIYTFDTLLKNLVIEERPVDISNFFNESIDDKNRYLRSINMTKEEGFLLYGGFDGNYGPDNGSWIVKTDFLLNKEWSKVYSDLNNINIQLLENGHFNISGVKRTEDSRDPTQLHKIKMSFDGMTDGKFISYFSDNSVERMGYMSNDLMNGEWEFYYLKDQLSGKGLYIDGDGSDLGSTGIPINGREGSWTFYDSTGYKMSELIYQEGRLNGLEKHFYTNGQLFSKGNYLKGKKNGDHIHYSPSGVDSTIISWNNDIGMGTEISWYDDSTKFSETVYNGRQPRKYISWYPNGNVRGEGYLYYKDDTYVGEFIRFYENGNKNYEKIKNGSGFKSTQWYENGKIMSERWIDSNDESTKLIKYDENGEITDSYVW
ncbi:hypothetical protein HOE22_02650 [Candidatus Woesearchaeota archaeon]|jgi:antitoxin component YwqK of YwqJK toxin-antitoxin module|nr:hypothetical protein [Candidatus Woesearchaeota archaeon]MBT4732878.1 hypothetical protein [Candidatus Woesearchaeota archaeon]